ncbi:MAG: hypothetical protein AAGF47_09175, partial [Planctomycetota bacterium]
MLVAGVVGWFNRSWFAADGTTKADATLGYVAPPLDGVWATAPYLHNGSMPDLAGVLDSRRRPERWTRSFDSRDYSLDPPGWRSTAVDRVRDGPDARAIPSATGSA